MPLADDVYADLAARLQTVGPAQAVADLCAHLRDTGDYGSLFYALLLQRRLELGVSPIPTGPAAELPPAHHEAYELAIRNAGRTVGELFLAQGDLPRAWSYYRMLGEPEPIRAALDATTPGDDTDPQPLIDIAFQQGVHPRKGFDWVLDRYGICTAITMTGGYEFPHGPEVRGYCIGRLVIALHEQLRERLRSEIASREGSEPASETSVPDLLLGRDWLFADDMYHIDTSHLSSVVQMAMQLPPGTELDLARELCVYGRRLGKGYQQSGDAPFADLYADVDRYLACLVGENVEANLPHFRSAVADPEAGTYPAEVFVNLLLRLNRRDEAIAIARQYLRDADERQLTCPALYDLCQQGQAFDQLAAAAQERNDPVHYLAALVAARQ